MGYIHIIKKCFIICLGLFLNSFLWGQSPQGFTYQVIIRDTASKVMENTPVGVKLTILDSASAGAVVYTETHLDTTNKNGMLTLTIGQGTSTDALHLVDWTDGEYFLKTETDSKGGSNYELLSVSPLQSVPYALYAENVGYSDTARVVDSVYFKLSDTEDTLYIGSSNQFFLIPVELDECALPFDSTKVVEVTSATGRVWMDRNLGACRVAESSTDTNAYGFYFQWGRGPDGHENKNSEITVDQATTASSDDTTTTWYGKFITGEASLQDWLTEVNDTLWAGTAGVNNPCPSGFRLPTRVEWEQEVETWDSEDDTGAFSSVLKLPLVGYRQHTTGKVTGAGMQGRYWTSTTYNGYASENVAIASAGVFVGNFNQVNGLPVRCIKEIETLTSSSGLQWMDRNLGAAKVADAVDDSLAFGHLFQWGRSADGHQVRNSETYTGAATSATSNPTDPWYGKFILRLETPWDWLGSNPDNNLWQGVDGVNNPCPEGFRLPTAAEWETEYSYWAGDKPEDGYQALKLTTAFYRDFLENANIITQTPVMRYWSSTVDGEFAKRLVVNAGARAVVGDYRARGQSVRCLKD